MKVVFLIPLILGVFLQATSPVAARKFEAVTELNTTAYLGVWRQAYASLTVKWTFEVGANCVTAEYGTTDEADKITVQNIVRPFASWRVIPFFDRFLNFFQFNGDPVKVNFYARQSPDIPGRLVVGIDEDLKYSNPGNYWIGALGPIVDDLYEWAIVSNSDQTMLYILIRDPAKFEFIYAEEVLALVEDFGFTDLLSAPFPTNQKQCFY